MAKTRIDRLPIELFQLAEDRRQAIGQPRSQAYRDIAAVALRVPGIIQQPISVMREPPKERPKTIERKKHDNFDFKI